MAIRPGSRSRGAGRASARGARGSWRPASYTTYHAGMHASRESRGWAWLALLALLVHGALLASALPRPFLGLNEDDNAVFGLGALGLARFGFTALRFGILDGWYDDLHSAAGHFYT